MAPYSSTLAWKIPWAEEPGRLQSLGLLRVGHDWATSLSLFHFHALEKEMATHSSVLAWRIPGAGEPGGLMSMGSHRVGHNWSDLAAATLFWGFPSSTSGKESTCQCRRRKRLRFNPWVRKIPWRTAWQPTPVFLPGESCGQRSLVGHSPWGRKESDMTEATEHTCPQPNKVWFSKAWKGQSTHPSRGT